MKVFQLGFAIKYLDQLVMWCRHHAMDNCAFSLVWSFSTSTSTVPVHYYCIEY